jgi:glycosyltransferase involved in cell wall biosynthesis
MSYVVREASEKGLDNLYFVGPMPNSQVLKYYQATDVCIIPSEEEGFPRKLLEAMACGLPIVAFDVGGIRDILGSKQQRFVVGRGDLEAFVSRVMECVQQPELRRELSEENLQMVQRFSTDRVAQMFVEKIVLG